ncbi:MAG: CDP-alcohol phosphatidyltransferase family protein [Clostridia bacterium]|nr:CDP-alcohol phosphatidyltransferase family protein [Clostridia bacterium]MDY5555104.1 CDP-alcohol phosphatidyltransferase family protein [Blautia sp.]
MKKELFSIPNLMGYFRILMLPVFLVCYHRAETPKDFVFTFLILGVIFLSDALDGYVARKYNMVTNFGKILDPVADKLVQGTLALAVASRHPLMKVFFLVFIIKEAYMAIMGLYLIKAKSSLNGAQWFGKICTAVIDIGVLILLFIPQMPETISNAIIILMLITELFVTIKYIIFHVNIIRKKSEL